jgi:hypothetical protein
MKLSFIAQEVLHKSEDRVVSVSHCWCHSLWRELCVVVIID